MDPARFQRAGELFDAALDLPIDERDSFLDTACGDDTELRVQVANMLEQDDRTSGVLDGVDASSTPPLEPAVLGPGAHLGPYRLDAEIGRGGMGVVYSATRDDDAFQRHVAVKVVRSERLHADGVWRFQRERQILAGLEHAHIARLYDGGHAATGEPYLVLEYVEGTPIDRYCDAQQLSLRERIELFLTVCSAVDYAHRNLIVHRDLKPSNILVDAAGQPKLLDFGIAKLLDPEAAGDGHDATRDHERLLTLSHTSPEQILGEAVTTASDVYCLGLILYTLVAGVPAFGSARSTPYELLRRITDTEPIPPSRMIGRRDAESTDETLDIETIAACRATSPAALGRALRGDLDTIVSKALRQAPEARYGTVRELAADLERHLTDRPIVAGNPSASERLRKFVRRHRAPVLVGAGSTLLIVTLVLTFVLALIQQVERTEREKDKAVTLLNFLTETFSVSNPDAAVGETVTARELLDSGARRIAVELDDEPEVRAMMLDAMGQIYAQIGLFESARDLLRTSLDERMARSDTPPFEIVESLTHLGEAFAASGEVDAAERLLNDAVARGRQLPDENGLVGVRSLEALAVVQMFRFDYEASEALYREALAWRRKLPSSDPAGRARARRGLGITLQELSRFDDARTAHRDALDTFRRIYGERHRDVAETLQELAWIEHLEGRDEAAVRLFRDAVAIHVELYGQRHRTIADAKNSLAIVLGQLGRHDEAATLYREAIEIDAELSGKGTQYAASLNNLAVSLTHLGRFAEAESFFDEALAIRTRALGEEHPLVGQTLMSLGRVHRRVGRLDLAEEHFRKAMVYTAALPPGHQAITYPTLSLVDLLIERGQGAEAEGLLRPALDELARSHPPDHWRIAMATADLGRALDLRGDSAGAERHLRDALDRLEASDADPAKARQVATWLADLYRRNDRHGEADVLDASRPP
ncbi:MAG: serine/threonine-protein kinase [Acidobacteriota bacterium]